MSLTALSARAMLAGLQSRELSSAELVAAHYARIDEVNPKINAIIQDFRQTALQEAQACDQARARGDARPLLGLPITIKENLATAGTPATLGVRARLGTPATEDAVISRAAKDCGAVVLGKTNIPLLLIAMETTNEIWGTTNNPWDLSRAPGGSSGGEAAAVATGMSPLGLGTDIGGSVRIPCAWTGVTGIKLTFGRWSNRGQHGAIPGQELVRAGAGPLARTVDDLVLCLDALSPERMHALDPRVPPVALGRPEQVDVSRLRIGVYEDDGFFRPAASICRVVREAADALARLGATIIEVKPPKAWEGAALYYQGLSADGGTTLREYLGDQAVSPQLASLFKLLQLPGPVRKAAAAVMRRRGEARVAMVLDSLGARSARGWWDLAVARNALQAEELAMWQAHGLHALLGPPTVTPAALHGETGDWTMAAWHTLRYNLLELPAGVLPAGLVRPDETSRPDARDRLEQKAARFEAGSAGLPVGVQVIGRPWEEHVVLAVMAALEQQLVDRAPRLPIDPREPAA